MLPKTIDRPMVRLIAMKRVTTGMMSLTLGMVGIVVYGMKRPPMEGHVKTGLLFAVFLLVTFGGGAWSLRDGVRLRRLLAESKFQVKTWPRT